MQSVRKDNFLILPCAVEDVELIREIQKEVWLTTYPNEDHKITKEAVLSYFQDKEKTAGWVHQVKEVIAHDKNTYGLKAIVNNKVVGYGFAKRFKDKNRIMSLYVLSEYQGEGIGRKLMEEMLKWFENANPIVLEVASFNTKAIEFYKKFGFIENGPVQNEVAAIASGVVIPEIEMIKN